MAAIETTDEHDACSLAYVRIARTRHTPDFTDGWLAGRDWARDQQRQQAERDEDAASVHAAGHPRPDPHGSHTEIDGSLDMDAKTHARLRALEERLLAVERTLQPWRT